MQLLEIFGIAVALSVDAMVVALCWGAVQPRIKLSHVLKFSVVFGAFQALMPALGWLAGAPFTALLMPGITGSLLDFSFLLQCQ